LTSFDLARKPSDEIENLIPVSADVLDVGSLEKALNNISPTHVLFTNWMRNASADLKDVEGLCQVHLIRQAYSQNL
jgi:hypothetical protein